MAQNVAVTPASKWFPHVAPTGDVVAYLSCPPGTEGPTADLAVELRLVSVERWTSPLTLVEIPGGQDTINVPSWSPYGSAFVDYPCSPSASFALVHPEGSVAEADFLSTGERTLTAIPCVEDFVVCRQVSVKSHHAIQFAMTFADQAAYDAYPEHRGFEANRWEAEVISFQELDLVPFGAE